MHRLKPDGVPVLRGKMQSLIFNQEPIFNLYPVTKEVVPYSWVDIVPISSWPTKSELSDIFVNLLLCFVLAMFVSLVFCMFVFILFLVFLCVP